MSDYKKIDLLPENAKPGAVVTHKGKPLLVIGTMLTVGNRVDKPSGAFYTVPLEFAAANLQTLTNVRNGFPWTAWRCSAYEQDKFFNITISPEWWEGVADPEKLEIADYPEFSKQLPVDDKWVATREEIKNGAVLAEVVRVNGKRNALVHRCNVAIIGDVGERVISLQFEGYHKPLENVKAIRPPISIPSRDRLIAAYEGAA